jgi:uncharacterized membrane protein
MKLDKLFDVHVVAGIAIGALVGLHYPLGEYKVILAIVALFTGMKVVGVLK